jgi:hypothetical protein
MATLFAVYAYTDRCGFPAEPDIQGSKEWRAKQIAGYDFAKPDFSLWQKDTGHTPYGLVMYLEMQQAFGWDAYKKVFAEYRALPQNERPKNDEEKRDQWMVRFSRQVGRNLGPFFSAWGVPVSDTARKSVADLPVWMPEELQKRLTAGQ